MKRIITAGAALALALALVAPTAALADETEPPPSDTVTTEQVVSEVTTPEAPVEPVSEAQEPAPEVIPEEPTEPIAEPIVEPAEEEKVVLSPATEESKGQPDFICTEDGEGWQPKVDWDGDGNPTVTAPEGFLIDAYCVKAGLTKWIIDDFTPAASVEIDHPIKDSVSHYQVHLIPVPPVEVTPLACVGIGDWYTEWDDLPPVQGDEGLIFQGGSGQAVGIRVPVTGNLQGWTSVSFENTGGQSEFFFRIVVDLSTDGGPSYKSLSFPGYSTIDQNSVSYQFGESIAATAAAYPNNVITSVGFQTNSGAVADYVAVLMSVTGPCATLDFSDPMPEDYSVPGEWSAADYDCDDTSYVETRIVTWHTFSRDESGVIVEATSETTEERTVEREADCPVVTPTPTVTPVPVSNTTTPLASTGGGDVSPILPIGAGIALLLGALAVAFGARHRRALAKD